MPSIALQIRANSSPVLDESVNALTLNTVGTAPVFGSSPAKYGAGALQLSGAGNLLVNGSPLILGSNDFTIQSWVYITGASVDQGLFHLSSATDGQPANYANGVAAFISNNKWTLALNAGYSTSTISKGSGWVHIAVCRSGSTTTLFVDGAVATSMTDPQNYSAQYLAIGLYYNNSYRMTGAIDDFQVITGNALYASAFTPPVELSSIVGGGVIGARPLILKNGVLRQAGTSDPLDPTFLGLGDVSTDFLAAYTAAKA